MSEPNKATMLAHLVDVKPSGSEGNIVKDIVFLDKNGDPVAFATADSALQVDKTKKNMVISLDNKGATAYLPVGNTGKAVLAAANGITPGNLASYAAATSNGKTIAVKADGTGFDFTDTYTDAKAVAAVKAKSQIAALTALATDADLATTVAKVNEVIAALKA
jgi:hypothetical protein|nr:MAG TPA: hypothetical protein [Caudoviricetes sp.]